MKVHSFFALTLMGKARANAPLTGGACGNLMEHLASNNYADFPDHPSAYKIKYKSKADMDDYPVWRAAIICKRAKRGSSEEDKALFDDWQAMRATSEKRGLFVCKGTRHKEN